MLIDSNIVIYSIMPGHEFLDAWLGRTDAFFSIITQIEVLGYSQLSDAQRDHFEQLFRMASVMPLDDVVTQACIQLRRNYKIKLADAIIAATALVHNSPLVTRNTEDFQNISSLQVIDPFAGGR